MTSKETQKTLALAGIFQAAYLAHQVAFNAQLNDAALETSLQSIFILDAPDVQSIFKGTKNVHIGLSFVKRFATKKPPFKDTLVMNNLLHITELAKKVLKYPAVFKHLQRRLQPIISQASHLGVNHDIVIDELASLYRQVFLGRGLQIPVKGNTNTLKKTEMINKIYAILVAGIRAAVLWYQMGGNRWQLLFLKQKLRHHAEILLNHEYTH